MRLAVLGAGAWGTAVAVSAASRHAVTLWARDADQARALAAQRENARYLPGVPLPAALELSDSLRDACDGAALVIVATPMAALGPTLLRLPEDLAAPVVWLCKGFEQGTGRLGHEIAAALRPQLRTGVVSGPSFALEVARGQPTAVVAASRDRDVAEAAVAALHSEQLRVYTSDDPVGVEVGGALKNVLAVATGIADGMPDAAGGGHGLGLNARAALVTRGLAEMTRLGVALGARADTFMGLSGLGDLVLTATGDLSRNRRVGLLLAAGQRLDQILENLGHVAEGVSTAPTALARAQALGVDLPITQAVVDVLDGRVSPARAVAALMTREARPERGAALDAQPGAALPS